MNSSLKRNYFFYVPGILIGACGLVSFLAWKAIEPTLRKNGFQRTFVSHSVSQQHTIEKPEDVTMISAVTDDSLYFQTKTIGQYYITDRKLEHGHYMQLLNGINDPFATAFDILLDKSKVKLLSGNTPKVFQSNAGQPGPVLKFASSILTRGLFIDSTQIIIRGFDTVRKGSDQYFIKYNLQTGQKQIEQAPIIERRGDGGLSTDGFIKYDAQTGLIVYVSVYTNHLIAFDTTLHAMYRSHTVDTVSSVQETSGKVEQNGKSMLTNVKPVRIINARGALSNGLLYINSRLKADNEENGHFLENSVIDVYEVKSGKYVSSFYLPYYATERVSDYKVDKNNMIAIYKSYIVTYSL